VTIEEQKRLLRFLLKRLRWYHHELNLYRAAFMNLSDPARVQLEQMREHYRHSSEIQAVTEKEFSFFDELVEQLDEDQLQKAVRELLGDYKGDGEPN
jgi:hypothetical protein